MPKQVDLVTQSEALKHVTDFVTQVENFNNTRHDLFVQLDRLYALRDEQRDIEPWLSDLQITGAFEFVERPFSALTANTPSFELVDRSKDAPMVELEPEVIDDPALGGDGQTVLKERLEIPWKEIYEQDLETMWKVRGMKQFLRKITKGGLIFGTYGAEIVKKFVERKDFEKILEDDPNGGEKSMVDEITPGVNLLDPFDMLVSPFAEDPEDAVERFGGFGVIRNYATIRDLDEDIYFNLDKVKQAVSASDDNSPVLSEKREKQQRVSNASDGKGGGGTFELIELWTYFSMDDEIGNEKLYIISLVNRDTVVRFEEINIEDDIPFSIFKDQEVPGQFWGIGEIEPIMANLYEENTLKNQRVDFNNRMLNEEWLLRSDAGIDPRQLVSKPHNIIVGDNIGDGDIRNVQRTSVGLSTSGEDIDRLRRDMVSTTGSIAIEATSGQGGLTNTATGEIIREQTAVARYGAKTQNLEFTVADIARKMLRVKADGLQEGELVPVFVRGKWREIDAELYKKFLDKYEVTVRAGSMNVKNSVKDRNDAIAQLNVLRQATQDGLQPDLQEAYRSVVASFSDADVEKMLPKALPQGVQGAQPGNAPVQAEGLDPELGALLEGPPEPIAGPGQNILEGNAPLPAA